MTSSMDRVGILIISKRLSAAAMIGAFRRSSKYSPEFYVAERQPNPYNLESATIHQVIPDLDVLEVAAFARKHKRKISFGLTDTEDFITAGGRDVVEHESGVPMLCVDRRHAVERSKADQRLLFDDVFKGANPRFAVFDPKEYRTDAAAVAQFKRFVSEVREPVIKPDVPGAGRSRRRGRDFGTEKEMVAFFRNVYAREGPRRREGRRRGVELPGVQRRTALRRGPADPGLQTGARGRPRPAHGGHGELPGTGAPPALPETL